MALKCGIVGLPNVGKSTLFNALSNSGAVAANFPFSTIEPNVAVVPIPDVRLNVLQGLAQSQRIIPASCEVVDIAGLVRGASKGEGLGNQFLASVREVDAIVHMIRCFEDENIVHVDGRVDPVADKEIINLELQLKDLEAVEKKMQKLEKLLKGGDARVKQDMETLGLYREALSQGINARAVQLPEEDRRATADLRLITEKPVIYVANVDEKSLLTSNAHVSRLRKEVEKENAELIVVCAALEAQIAALESDEDKAEFLKEYGLEAPTLHALIRSAYRLLGLITYFTAGESEARAWTICKGWKAAQAAGVIHSDFERGFIKAEIIKLLDYQQYRTELACREAGKLAIEGKDYVVEDGDVVHFRFNI